MKITFKTYITLFFVIFFSGLLAVATTNYAIDPYNDLGRNTIGLYFSTERQAKARVREIPHNAILMGSSRVARINPNDLCGYDFYNASFSSALPEEIYFFLRDYVRDEKLVAIGLDFYMFNEYAFPVGGDPLHSSVKKKVEYLLGFNVFKDSLRAIHYHRNGKQEVMTEKGSKAETWAGHQKDGFDPKVYLQWIRLFQERNYYNYQLSLSRLDYVEKTYQMLLQKGIKPVFFINPVQQQLLTMELHEPLKPIFLEWKGRLKTIVPDLVDLTSPEYGYSDPRYFILNDPSHYLPETGALFLNKILGCE